MNERIIEEEQSNPFTLEEVSKYTKKLRNRNASGPDGIPYEFYKEGER